MEKLSPYEIKILTTLSKQENGLTLSDLSEIYGNDVYNILLALVDKNYLVTDEKYEGTKLINTYWYINHNGKAYLMNKKSIDNFTLKKELKDRIIGFITGVIITLIGVVCTIVFPQLFNK